MVKDIIIGDRHVRLKSTAGTALFYKRTFRKELLKEIVDANIEDLGVIDTVQKLAFIMAKQADGTPTQEMLALTDIDYISWLDEFNAEAFQNADTIFAILGVWNTSITSSVSEKN